MNLNATILSTLANNAQKLAICEPDGRRISYLQLRHRIVALASYLVERGFRPGHRVVLQIPNGIELAVATVAVLTAGGIAVFCEPGLGKAFYLSRIRTAQPDWLLIHPMVKRINSVPGLSGILSNYELEIPPLLDFIDKKRQITLSKNTLDLIINNCSASVLDQNIALKSGFVAPRRNQDDAIIIFTGGTTSNPKGVRHTHKGIEHFLTNISSVIDAMKVERFLADTPQQMLYALCLGRSVFVTRGKKRRRAKHVLKLVLKGQVDAYFGAPYIWMEMLALDKGRTSRLPATLKTVLLGSAPVTREFLCSLSAWLHPTTHILSIYGLTEAGPVCVVDCEKKLKFEGTGDLVGLPLENVKISIDNQASPNGIGEVLVHSPSLYGGYLNQPPRKKNQYLRTGDLGCMIEVDDQKQLVLLGRTKDMIIKRGVNIYPQTLEPSIRALSDDKGPLLRDCAMVGLWNPNKQDEELILCIELAQNRESIDINAFKQQVAKVVGPDGTPEHILVVKSIPVTGRQNKIDREALRFQAEATFHISTKCNDWDWLPGAIIPFDFESFLRKYLLLLRKEHNFLSVASQMAVRLMLYAVGQAGWALDQIIASKWRQEMMRGPLFILGHQRSGTTFLHRLLAADTTNARALALHEMLLPAISIQKLLNYLVTFDSKIKGFLKDAFRRWEERLFSPLDDIHRIRFSEIEEDEFVLWSIFSSGTCVNDAPSTVELPQLNKLRHFHQWSQKRQVRTLGFYNACLKKKLYRDPMEHKADQLPWIVSKNPAFTHKIKELCKVFEDARFIYLVRNPKEAIPSRLSLIREIWRRRFPGFGEMTSRQVEVILKDSLRTYLSAERVLPKLYKKKHLTIQYEYLIQNPKEIVEKIYNHFELPGPDIALYKTLSKIKDKPTKNKPSRHQYSLEEFGLDKNQIQNELRPVFEKYKFGN
ncbi:MAG: AMP-binding protein [Planctomycetota bacterium]|jgi:acyl-CoA synthetase (AMP-forming)/AMP-acid ligase II